MKSKRNLLGVRISLQFFAEGAEGGAADAGHADSGTAAEGTVDSDDLFMAEMEQKYGIVDGVASAQAIKAYNANRSDAHSKEAEEDGNGAQGGADNGTATDAGNKEPQKTAEEEFDELIKSDKFKGIYGSRVAGAINERFKNQTDARAEADRLKGAISLHASKYGKSAEDIDGIVAAMQADDELLEKEAMESGKSVEAIRSEKKSAEEKRATEQELETLRQKLADREAQDKLYANMVRWTDEGKETKKIYPDFDLKTELANQDFRRYLASGMKVTDAYKHAHLEDIIAGSIRAVEEKAYADAARVVQTNKGRPSEGAAGAGKTAASPRIDVKNMSDADYEEIERRLARGEEVGLDRLRV